MRVGRGAEAERGALRRRGTRPGGGGGGRRPRRARHGLRPRAAPRREPPHRARGPGGTGPDPEARPEGADGDRRSGPRRAVRARARLPARPAHQRGRPHAACRRRPRAASDRRRSPGGRGRPRARLPEPRPPGGRDPDPVRGRGRRRDAGAPGRDRGGRRGLAPGRRRDRGVAPRGALAPPVRGDRAGRVRCGGRLSALRPRLRPQHLRLRPARRAGRVLRAPHALRRPQDGRRRRAGRGCGRAVPPRARRPRRGGALAQRPHTGRAGRRGGSRRRARPRARRGPRAAAPVRDGEPPADPARAGRSLRARDRDGGGEGALPVHARHRRRQEVTRRSVPLPPKRARPGHRGHARHSAAVGEEPLERCGRATRTVARALPDRAGRAERARRRRRLLGRAAPARSRQPRPVPRT